MSSPDPSSPGDGARTPAADAIQAHRASGPGLLSRLPGMAYQCRNDPDWTMEFVSGGGRSLTGYDPSDLIGPEGITYGELIHPDDRDRVWEEVQQSISDPDSSFDLQYRIVRANGDVCYVWEQGQPIWAEDGALLGLEGFVTDVTELRLKTEELETSREMLQALADQKLFGVYVILHGVFAYVNEAMAETFGYERHEIVNEMGPLDLVSAEDRERVSENLRKRVEGEVPDLAYSFRGVKKDGNHVEVEVHGARSLVDGEPAVSGVLLDVTDRRRLEEQARQAQKMEAVGLMASGIAHDFNNLLTAVGGHARLLLDRLPSRKEILECVDEIRRASDRATILTRQMLDFARDSRTADGDPSDLNEVMVDLHQMIESMSGDSVQVEWSIDDQDIWVGLDQGRIGQIVMNLVANAKDAMPDGGTLRIRTSTVELDEEYARDHLGVDPGHFALLGVRDTGLGMPPDVRDRIFEPFYTTKERGKGTGLGLSSVYGMVKQAGGHIWVYSEVGQGTHFKIHLPLLEGDEMSEHRSERAADAPGRLHGSESVLVVDDDPAVLSVSQKILERYGYSVVGVENAEAAIQTYESRSEEIALLITDVVLPGWSGLELVEELRNRGAKLPVVFVSGYTEDSVNQTAREDPAAVFLEKPYDPKHLVGAVRRLLDSNAELGDVG